MFLCLGLNIRVFCDSLNEYGFLIEGVLCMIHVFLVMWVSVFRVHVCSMCMV